MVGLRSRCSSFRLTAAHLPGHPGAVNEGGGRVTYWAERRMPTLPAELLARVPAEIPRWKIAYWQFQRELTDLFILPFLKLHHALPESGRLLEVGAGEGGCLAALQEETGLPADALELSPKRTELAEKLNAVLTKGHLNLRVGDIADPGALSELTPPYSLILMRDVLEHIEKREGALTGCRSLLAPGGHLLLTFPPYYSPYGAHQQVLGPRWLKLPWLQVLPFYLRLVAHGEPVAAKAVEMAEIGRCALTIGKLERSARECGLTIVARDLYLTRPAFRYRYGLPVIRAGVLSHIPGLRELLVTGAWYLLTRMD